MQLLVNDLVTHYQLLGKGRLVVLLHGWGDSLVTFTALQTELSKKFQVIAVDLPGFGKTDPPAEVWNLDDYAQFVSDFLRKLDVGAVHAYVGHSNGAAVLVRGFGLKTLTADKLVLMGAAGIRNPTSLKLLGIKAVAKVGKVATFWLPASTRQKLQAKLYGTIGSDMLVVPQLKETFKRTVKQDVRADAALVSVPTLLLYGADDRATPPALGAIFAKNIKGSRLEILDRAGHFVHLDQAEVVTQQIMEFIA